MAQIRKPIHDDGPVNAGEQRLLDYLDLKLPSNYIIIPNLNIAITGQNRVMKYWEYDCIVVAPHAVYHIENKDYPELREKIFSDELFMYRCPHCGKVTGIPAGTLYHDMTHGFMIFFDFFKPDDYDYSPMEIPEGVGLKKEYLFRAVFGLQRFKEKIVILEHGLNDVAIEHQKYMISHVIMPEIAEKGYELFFAKTEEPNEEFPYGTIYFFYDDEEKEQTMQIRFAMDNYFEHKLACERCCA